MISNVMIKIKQEIDSEKKNRIQTEEALLNLLDDTVNKINNLTI